MPVIKKVLIIAYLFPPIGGGGVQRALKMAKYLGEFGWEVHVLTVDPIHHVSLDHSLLDQLPKEVHIHRSKELSLWNRKTKSAQANQVTQVTQTKHPNQANLSKPSEPTTASSSIITSFKKFIIQQLKKVKNALLVPDDQILWVPFAKRKGLEIIKEHQIDVILSTSGPYSNHLVGGYLKRKTGKVWIADFRDPWTQNMHHTQMKWRKKLEEKLEQRVLRDSDCLLTVTKSFANNFKQKYPNEINQMQVIHNGYDRQDYETLVKKQNDKFTLIYTGIFYKERNPRLLLSAVAELLYEQVIPKERIHLQFAGVFDYPGNNENMDCVRKLDLENNVEIMGHLPHKKALQAMKQADALMLINDTHPESGNYIPGKLYEYMAIGHPILALSLPGESTHIIENYHLGEIVEPTSLEQMKKALVKLYHEWENSKDIDVKDRDNEKQDSEGQITEDQVDAEQDTEELNSTIVEKDSEIAKPPRASALIYERKEQARMLAELMDELMRSDLFE